jgi:hypothetical protein
MAGAGFKIGSALGLVLAVTVGRAEAAQVDGNGKAKEESAEGIEPGMVGVDGLAECPRQRAEDESDVGDLEEAAEFGVEASRQGMHERFSFFEVSG